MAPWSKKYKLTRQEVAGILEDFLHGTGKPHDWDSFTLGMLLEDDYLEQIRLRLLGLSEEFPPAHQNEYCNEEGRNVIQNYIAELRRPN
jgi:hypothetical protein